MEQHCHNFERLLNEGVDKQKLLIEKIVICLKLIKVSDSNLEMENPVTLERAFSETSSCNFQRLILCLLF